MTSTKPPEGRTGLRIESRDLILTLTRSAELLPWLGPALRGLAARQFKERTCRHSVEERRHRWLHCTGCPHLLECPYGSTFEPEPPPGVRSQPDSPRPIVLAPYYPVPTSGTSGLRIPLRVSTVGGAADHLGSLIDALAEAGAERGLGEDRGTFTVEPLPDGREESGLLQAWELPATAQALAGRLPRVGIGLTSPLFLAGRDHKGKRRPNLQPLLTDLLRAATNALRDLFRLHDRPLSADFAGLLEAAASVPLLEHCYEPFEQKKFSSRQGKGFDLVGVVGGGIYGDMPMSLLPWLVWGGRIHVGGHRVAGAGGWRLVLD